MEMNFDEQGKGSPVLLIHGLGATGNVWGGCLPSLSRHFKTFCPDLYGSGRSPMTETVSTPYLVQALLEFIQGHSMDRPHVIGHSYGSVLAQHLAVQHGDQVRSVSLIGPIQAAPDAAKKALVERAAKARSEGLAAIANATVQVGTSSLTKAHRPEVAAFVRELVMGQDPRGYAATCEAVAGSEPARIETIRCPALVVTGDEDATSPAPVAKVLADKIPGCQFHVLTGCGHWTPLEQTQQLTERLFNFLMAH